MRSREVPGVRLEPWWRRPAAPPQKLLGDPETRMFAPAQRERRRTVHEWAVDYRKDIAA